MACSGADALNEYANRQAAEEISKPVLHERGKYAERFYATRSRFDKSSVLEVIGIRREDRKRAAISEKQASITQAKRRDVTTRWCLIEDGASGITHDDPDGVN